MVRLLLFYILFSCAPESIDIKKAKQNFNASISDTKELDLNTSIASKSAVLIKQDISESRDSNKLGHALINLIEQSEYQEDILSIKIFINNIAANILEETINYSNEKGLTPLIAASMSSQNEIIELLLTKGADPILPRTHGEILEDPLQIVCIQGNIEALQYFDLKEIPIEHKQRIASKVEIHHPQIAEKLRKID